MGARDDAQRLRSMGSTGVGKNGDPPSICRARNLTDSGSSDPDSLSRDPCSHHVLAPGSAGYGQWAWTSRVPRHLGRSLRDNLTDKAPPDAAGCGRG
jgi:hypothetical protein